MRRLQAQARGAAPVTTLDLSALPNRRDSVKFAVIGDSGTGGRAQQQVADRMAEALLRFRYTFTIMLGDNLYGARAAAGLREEVRAALRAPALGRA